MNGPVVMLRDWCSRCWTVRDVEVSLEARPVSSGYAVMVGCTEDRTQRCLHCGRVEDVACFPGQLARALRSATYGAA